MEITTVPIREFEKFAIERIEFPSQIHVYRTCQLSPTSRIDERDSRSFTPILSGSISIQGKPQPGSSGGSQPPWPLLEAARSD
jgi:hypothetical protein